MITTSLSINFTQWLSGQDWLSHQRSTSAQRGAVLSKACVRLWRQEGSVPSSPIPSYVIMQYLASIIYTQIYSIITSSHLSRPSFPPLLAYCLRLTPLEVIEECFRLGVEYWVIDSMQQFHLGSLRGVRQLLSVSIIIPRFYKK